MRLSFDSIEEVREFVKGLKTTRGGKNDGDDTGATAGGAPGSGGAPAPLQPPQGGPVSGFNPGGFAPQGPGAGQAGGFPAAAAGPSPEVLGLVSRIVAAIDKSVATGSPVEKVLEWFRGQLGPETASYTMDQVKASALPRAAQPVLENIAKLMNA